MEQILLVYSVKMEELFRRRVHKRVVNGAQQEVKRG